MQRTVAELVRDLGGSVYDTDKCGKPYQGSTLRYELPGGARWWTESAEKSHVYVRISDYRSRQLSGLRFMGGVVPETNPSYYYVPVVSDKKWDQFCNWARAHH